MDIRNWDLDSIMRLPDWCFGRKFIVSAEVYAYNDNLVYDISEMAFPENMVIWQLHIETFYMNDLTSYIRIALGDQIPTSQAMFMLLDALIPSLGITGPDPRELRYFTNAGPFIYDLRTPVAAAGRRLCLLGYAPATKHGKCRVVVVCSSMPTEVPDWLVSVKDKSLI